MKTIMLVVLTAGMALGQDPRSSAAPASNQSRTPVPKGAIEIEPNLFRYTDSYGKVWLARRTPFGLSTWEDKPAPPAPVVAPDTAPPVKATDLGDNVRFVKNSPFGVSTWVKKKSELTDEEKDWLAGGTKTSDRRTTPQSNSTQSARDTTEKR
jgi:hypothetical protein